MIYQISNGWLMQSDLVSIESSSHCEVRSEHDNIELLVVHNISLPPGQFGNNYISDLFMGRLDKNAHPYFEAIHNIRVSAHCLIRRTGEIVQYVSFNDKAWHAGVSCYNNKDKCNDFSIGIELEGTDDTPYTKEQYQQLTNVTLSLQKEYPQISNNIVGHSDIAPGRKTDPGPSFDWQHFFEMVKV